MYEGVGILLITLRILVVTVNKTYCRGGDYVIPTRNSTMLYILDKIVV